MGRQIDAATARFLSDERGSVAIIFTLVLVVLVFAVGVAVDFARVLHARSGLVSAADAAALATGRALGEGGRSDTELKALAEAYFQANLGDTETFAGLDTMSVAIDRDTGKVRVDVAATVPMTLTRIAGFDNITFPVMAETVSSRRDVELSLVLDVTGSMSGSKIADLRAAATDLVDLMLPDAGRASRARIALTPYAASVNAGSYFNTATGRRNGTGCVIERSGTAKFEEDAPAAGAYIGYDKDADCPTATVQPLTASKSTLNDQISRLRASGYTAGHIGAAWGWYLVSPSWSRIWSGDSAPAAYDAKRTIKAVLLMTDGEFNTQYVRGNGSSATQARALCENMKEAGVVVYSVAFMAGSAAEALLRECATSPGHYFPASNGVALKAAFQSVGRSLTDLHLTQ